MKWMRWMPCKHIERSHKNLLLFSTKKGLDRLIVLCVDGAVVTRMNKSGDEIADYITKKQYVDKLLMEVRIHVSEKDKKVVQKVVKELFGTSVASEDEDTNMRNFQSYSQRRIEEMERLEINYQHYAYPGKKVITEGKKLLFSVIQRSFIVFIEVLI